MQRNPLDWLVASLVQAMALRGARRALAGVLALVALAAVLANA